MAKIETYRLNLRQRLKRRFKQLKLYCYISIIGGILMFSLLYIFTSVFEIHYILSFTIAYLVTGTNGFLLNKFFVFKLFNPKAITKQYYQFFIVSISAYVANFISLYVLVEFVGIWYLLAQLMISVVGLPILFIIHKSMTFSHR